MKDSTSEIDREFQASELFALTVHELKNPLTVLRLHVQMLQMADQAHLPTRFKENNLKAITKNAEKQINYMESLLNALWEVGQLKSGLFRLNSSQMNLSELVQSTVDSFANSAELSNRSAISIIPTKEVFGFLDRLRLEQVIRNLLSNAIKYGEGKPIEVTVSSTKDRAFLRITDEGRGISPEDQQIIFNRFQRCGPDRKEQGLGLGLYIVKKIVEAHGGRVTVQSEVGMGSCFCVELPCK